MPFSIIPFLLLVVPILEIATFIVVGGQIGVVATLGMILFTAVLGSILLRIQGFQVLNQLRAATDAGRVPGRELGHGVMILLAGVLLRQFLRRRGERLRLHFLCDCGRPANRRGQGRQRDQSCNLECHVGKPCRIFLPVGRLASTRIGHLQGIEDFLQFPVCKNRYSLPSSTTAVSTPDA